MWRIVSGMDARSSESQRCVDHRLTSMRFGWHAPKDPGGPSPVTTPATKVGQEP
jgi:hypothetical protein